MHDLQEIEKLVSDGRTEDAVDALAICIDEAFRHGNHKLLADLYFRRGKLNWRLGRRADATSDYAKSADIDPTGPAVKALEQARDIEAFFNPDLYNP